MRFSVVTSFSNAGLDKYGRRCIETFTKHWPKNIDLTVYFDGWYGDFGYRVPLRNLHSCAPWLGDFQKKHRDDPKKDMRYHAVRFAPKVAAWTHMILRSRQSMRYVIWIDGDTLTHSPIDERELQSLMPRQGDCLSWLERKHNYPECGWFAIDMAHPQAKDLAAGMVEEYTSGRLFKMEQWHDSWVMQEVVKRCGIPTTNLSGAGWTTAHPFINSDLGRWFDHLKGARKNEGKSRKRDLRVRREEAYWQ